MLADQGKNLSREQLCPVEHISSCRDGTELGCLPTVGRWGNEWPSWLKNTQECIQNLIQVGGEWPDGHPLPLPRWGRSKQPLILSSVEEYEELAQIFEYSVQNVLQLHNYNTVGNFIRWVFTNFSTKFQNLNVRAYFVFLYHGTRETSVEKLWLRKRT